MTINDVDAPYQLNEMDLNDLAVLLNVLKPPLKDDIYNLYKLLGEDECECFVDELAKCYKKASLIGGVVVFFDNHNIPYYGGFPIGFVYHATRNMPIKGIHLAQLNDINGNFILFKLIPSTTAFANANSELTKLISSDGQPMKVNRAKKILYRLPGKITFHKSLYSDIEELL